ncbi:2-phosphoglycolate phosphatase [Meredithblackwellia eburnea MCA 4105]
MPKRLTTKEDFKSFLDAHDTFLFDLDGVVWSGPRGDELTPNVTEAVQLLRTLGKRLAFVTNNATQSRYQYLNKFHRLGLNSVQLHEIFTCGSASATYLKEHILPDLPPEQRGVYLIGQAGLEEELREVGLTWKGGSDPTDSSLMPLQDFSSITPDPSIGVVLFSFQMHFGYRMISKAYNYLGTNKNCKLVLTNDDATVLIPDGVCPGEGAMASVLYNARKGLQPIIVGKPHQPLLDVVHSALKFDPKRTVMCGDRLETDVLFGKRGGVSTLLVLTGSSILEDVDEAPLAEQPDFIADCIGNFLKSVA